MPFPDYTTKDGDMVDLIAYRHYGDEAGRVAIYDANPWIADKPLELPAGLTVKVPDWEKPKPATPKGGLLG